MRHLRTIVVITVLIWACAPVEEPVAEAPTLTTGVTTTTVADGLGAESDVAADDDPAEEDHDDADHEAAEENHDDAAEEADDHASETADEVDRGRVIEVVMTDFAFEPPELDVSAGESVTFVVENRGAIEHELRLSNDHRVQEHLESGHEGHGDSDHHGEADAILLVGPGEVAELTVTIPEDETFFTDFVCLIPGHYEAGMIGSLHYEG